MKGSVQMRSAICLVSMLALAACVDDEVPTDPQIDGGPPDASVDAKVPDAKVPDAQVFCPPLDGAYKFYLDGGLSPLHHVYTLSGPGTVKLEAVPGGAYMDAGTYSCTGSLGICSSSGLDVSDFTAALSAVSSRWGDGTTVYGQDDRPSDGQVLIVERTSDAKKIVIGTPCAAGSSSCTAIPAAVAQLKTVFDRLRTEIPLGDKGDGGLAGSCH